MANNLTGDYDVVAHFSLGAIDRILAVMHRGKRLPHALSMAVDDYPDFGRFGVAAVSIVDRYGSALTDPARVMQTARLPAVSIPSLTPDLVRALDPVVNWRPDPTPVRGGTISLSQAQDSINEIDTNIHITPESTFLSGVALLLMGSPTMQLQAGHSDQADVHSSTMIRYYPDPGTRSLSAFMRGDVITTFGIVITSSPAGPQVVVKPAGVRFNPLWSDVALDASDRTHIDKLLTKTVRESFQHSSPLPSNVKKMHFKGIPAAGEIAVMMNVTSDNNPSPGSVNNGLVRPGEQFALAVSGDAIVGPFTAAVNTAINPFRTKTIDFMSHTDYWLGTWTFHIYTKIVVQSAIVQLLDQVLPPGIPGRGIIRLTIPVKVTFTWEHLPSVFPKPQDFDFTITQDFTLSLYGRQVGLQRLGDVSVKIPDGVPDYAKNPANQQATTLFNNAWNSQEAAIQQRVNAALNAESLQSFLRSLMNRKAPTVPGPKPGIGVPVSADSAPEQVNPELTYNYFEIRPAGFVLNGELAVPPWPSSHVEFDKDPWAPAALPEFRALNSWIPGGTIKQFQWNYTGVKTVADSNRFITTNAPALLPSSSKICLTFNGKRITASGPIAYEDVFSPRTCKWTFPGIGVFKDALNLSAADRPHVIVPKKPGPIPEERLEVAAHVSPWTEQGQDAGTANFLIHFPDDNSAGHAEILLRALDQSGRSDTATTVLSVLTREQLETVRPLEGMLYADDAEKWEHLLKVRERPVTVLLNPSGDEVWRHQGEMGGGGLANALRRHLGAGGKFYPQFVESPLRVGELPPNFIFEYIQGEYLTLRKLLGRSVVLLFWRSSSSASLAALRDLQKASDYPGLEAPLIMAIDDGEDSDFARGLAANEESNLVVIPDKERQIARAYGISMWPTLVFLDVDGFIRDIRFGLADGRDNVPDLENSFSDKLPAASPSEKENC